MFQSVHGLIGTKTSTEIKRNPDLNKLRQEELARPARVTLKNKRQPIEIKLEALAEDHRRKLK